MVLKKQSVTTIFLQSFDCLCSDFRSIVHVPAFIPQRPPKRPKPFALPCQASRNQIFFCVILQYYPCHLNSSEIVPFFGGLRLPQTHHCEKSWSFYKTCFFMVKIFKQPFSYGHFMNFLIQYLWHRKVTVFWNFF